MDQTSNTLESAWVLVTVPGEELTDLGSVIGGTKDQLGCTVISRADVRDIGFVLDQDFGAAKVAELQYPGVWIEQKVLRLDIPMTDSLGMYVR